MIARTLRTLSCPLTVPDPRRSQPYALFRALVDLGMDPSDACDVAFGGGS